MLTFRAAVICDPCSQKHCVESCCSHLQMAKFDHHSGKIKCENPPGPGPSNFKSPKMPTPLENMTFVKSDNRYSNCDDVNGTMTVSDHYQLGTDGTSVSSGTISYILNILGIYSIIFQYLC